MPLTLKKGPGFLSRAPFGLKEKESFPYLASVIFFDCFQPGVSSL